MTAFSNSDRRAGRAAMEKSLSPIQKAYRKFLSGAPPATPKNSPLGAVTLVAEQRNRLARILEKEKTKARIAATAVVIRFVPPSRDALADTIPVHEGKEGQAISFLEMYGAKFKRQFVITGLMFTVTDGKEDRFFAYPIERTPEGEAALLWSCQRAVSGQVKKSN
jgi:hypothetical protein